MSDSEEAIIIDVKKLLDEVIVQIMVEQRVVEFGYYNTDEFGTEDLIKKLVEFQKALEKIRSLLGE